jgi:hypothetical protein
MLGLRQAHVVPSLAETVQAVVIMGDVRETGGARLIVQEAWAHDFQGAFAANFSQVALANPPGSGRVVTLREARVQSPEATLAVGGRVSFSVEFAGGLGTPSGNVEAFRNSRLIDPTGVGAVQFPAGAMSHTLAGALVPRPFSILLDGPGERVYRNDVVLYPGWRVLWQSVVVNTGLEVACTWEEEELGERPA